MASTQAPMRTRRESVWLRFGRALRPNDMIRVLSGVPLLWAFLPDGEAPALTIHRTFYRLCWRESGSRDLLYTLAGSVWVFPMMLVLAAVYSARCGGRVSRETGKSVPRQFCEALALGCRAAVPVVWYYMFELYRADRRARVLEYLYRTELKGKGGIYEILRQRRAARVSADALSDKALFTARCAAAGVPAVEVLAFAQAGRIVGNLSALPPCDLFFKPNRGTGGRGASRWLYDGAGYVGSDGQRLSAARLAEHLCALSHDRPYLVARCVYNHPLIADLSPGALSTVRALTCLNEHGEPELTHAVLRMARSRAAVVDNFHAGGIAALVDLKTGTLGSATDMGLTAASRWWDSHPTTGAPIRGRVLPRWPELREVALRAHWAFADQVAIGWDIALTPDGPVVIEGNKSPDLDIIQRVGSGPVGNSRLGVLLARHLEEALAQRVPPG